MIHTYENVLISNSMRVTMFYFIMRMPNMTLFQCHIEKCINLKLKCIIIKCNIP